MGWASPQQATGNYQGSRRNLMKRERIILVFLFLGFFVLGISIGDRAAVTFLTIAANAQETITPTEIVRGYLNAAGRQDGLASKTFLATGCTEDFVVEFQANAHSGWNYSEQDTWVGNEAKSADGRSATVKAQIIFKGGSTSMMKEETFSLISENGQWKISRMNPKPRSIGPGVSPL